MTSLTPLDAAGDLEARFCWAVGMARIAQVIPQIPDIGPSPMKGALLSLMLPGIQLVSLVSVLDDALADYIEKRGITWPPGRRQDLYNRIEVVGQILPTLGAARLHTVRQKRNEVAHEAGIGVVTWPMLDDAIEALADALEAMGVLRHRPKITAFFQRTPTLFPNLEGPAGETLRHTFVVGAKNHDRVFIEFNKEIAYFPPGVTPPPGPLPPIAPRGDT